jgi:hypothetical protein
MKLYNLLLLLVVFHPAAFTQDRFLNGWLEKPLDHTTELDSQFTYTEVPVYEFPQNKFYKALENGYASAVLIQPENWTPGLVNIQVKEIDIVFTKYPFKKSDWITNYHRLLASRLQELYKIDPSLNSQQISYRLVLQTDCKNERQTKTFYHGIVIKFELISPELKIQLNPKIPIS